MKSKNLIYGLFFLLTVFAVNLTFFYPQKKMYKPRNQTIARIEIRKIENFLDELNLANKNLQLLNFNIKGVNQELNVIVQFFDKELYVWVKSNSFKNHYEISQDLLNWVCQQKNTRKSRSLNDNKQINNLFCNNRGVFSFDIHVRTNYCIKDFIFKENLLIKPLSPPPKALCL